MRLHGSRRVLVMITLGAVLSGAAWQAASAASFGASRDVRTASLPVHLASGPVAPDLDLFPAAVNAFVGGPDLSVGQTIGVVPGGAGLGSFDIRYNYDPASIDLALSAGPMLASTGRVAACSATHPSPTQARLACTSSGAMTSATGAGVLVLLAIHRKPGAPLPADGVSHRLAVIESTIATTTLLDTQGSALALQRAADVLVTARALAGDVTGDCVVDAFDEQAIFGRFGRAPGDPLYSTAYDIVPPGGDGQINSADAQFVVSRAGSTCAAPVPAQPPVAVDPVDADDDEVPTAIDNCPLAYNPGQQNTDAANGATNRAGADGLGDACDAEISGDGYSNTQKTALAKNVFAYCPTMRADVDGDGVVSILDLAMDAGQFNKMVTPATERLNQDSDNVISILDLSLQADVFNKAVGGCP